MMASSSASDRIQIEVALIELGSLLNHIKKLLWVECSQILAAGCTDMIEAHQCHDLNKSRRP